MSKKLYIMVLLLLIIVGGCDKPDVNRNINQCLYDNQASTCELENRIEYLEMKMAYFVHHEQGRIDKELEDAAKYFKAKESK